MTEGAYSDHHPSVTPPKNPWNTSYWTGISSSGSSVATAAGLCYGAIGSDTGGSIRWPCGANGLTGLKPTWGRVSRFGVFELAASLDHIGTIARSAADAAAILGVIAGSDAKDPTTLPDPVPDYLGELRGRFPRLFQTIDLLLTPVHPFAPLSLAAIRTLGEQPELILKLQRYTAPFNFTGSPTITMPGGFSEAGLPIGLQLIARHLDEANLVRAGVAFQNATAWHQRHPPGSDEWSTP